MVFPRLTKVPTSISCYTLLSNVLTRFYTLPYFG
jgi:hypothetical protein